MATLARLFDFLPGDTIRSADVDGEFNQLVGLLNGTSTSIQAYLQLQDNALAVVKLNQVTSNASSIIQEWFSAGVQRAKFDGLGRLHSTVVGSKTGTGNEPFVVASSKLVTNLNADMVDGLHASDIGSVIGGTFTSDITISNTNPMLTFEDTTASEADLEIELDNDGTDQQLVFRRASDDQKIFRINVDQGTAQFHNIVVLRTDAGGDVDITVPVGGSTPDQHLTPKKYVDALKTRWGIGAYFNGVVLTTMQAGQFMCPNSVVEFTFTHIKILFTLGTLTGNTVIEVRKNGVSIGTGTVTNVTSPNTVVSNDIVDGTLVADDRISFHVTSAGGHENVTCQLCGTQKVSNS